MDKENGKGSENGSTSKLSSPPDPAALLDAASLFGGNIYYTAIIWYCELLLRFLK